MITLIDKRTSSLVTQYIPNEKQLRSLATLFGALSDPTRIKILSALAITEMCVSDISNLLGINQTTLSHSLASLRAQHLVDYKRQGKIVFYYIPDRNVLSVMTSAVECMAKSV